MIEDDIHDVTADKTNLEGSSREPRLILIRRKPVIYNSQFIYPPVNFIANGKPSKIFVNNVEYKGESGKKPTLSVSKDDDIVLNETTTSRPDSPITWLSGRGPLFNDWLSSYIPLLSRSPIQ